MLVTLTARLVRSHGTADTPLPGGGAVQLAPVSHGVLDGALRGRDSVRARIVDGVMEQVEVAPGPWRVSIYPEHGPAWDSWQIELVAGMPEPVDLVSLAPVVVVDGEKWARGASAYDVAVAGGFTGTVEEWLASLHPVISWDGPHLVVDGMPSPDLTGPQGPEPDTTAALAAYTSEVA